VLLEANLRRVHAGESLDPDEDDPYESFQAQYLNVWPAKAGPHSGARLLPETLWDALQGVSGHVSGPVWIAVEDNYGKGAAVAAVGVIDDRFEIDGWECDSWRTALDDAVALLQSRPVGSRLIVGQAVTEPPNVRFDRAGATDTRLGLALFRDLARSGRVVHDASPELDAQIEACRVRDVPGGGLAVITTDLRADIVRAAVWALREAQARTRVPAIR
jgi:hypothetical protein